jgi:hypothetical protein
MGEFFRGWKRKVGCVTLAAACVFALGWIRSYERRDFLNLRLGNSVIRIASLGAHFKFIHVTPAADNQFGWDSYPEQPGYDPTKDLEGYDLQWHAHFLGFYCGCGILNSSLRTTIFTTPYSSIVIPLSLLSAWCLLTKPRSKSVTKSEPAHA